jgi:hypothetical protein
MAKDHELGLTIQAHPFAAVSQPDALQTDFIPGLERDFSSFLLPTGLFLASLDCMGTAQGLAPKVMTNAVTACLQRGRQRPLFRTNNAIHDASNSI